MGIRFLAAAAAAFGCAALAAAELHAPHRVVEVGADVQAAVSNNYFKVQDFFNGTLDNFDFQEMAAEIPETGWDASLDFRVQALANVNLEKFRIGVFAGAEGTGNVAVGKGLFDYLAADFDSIEARVRAIPADTMAALVKAKDTDGISAALGLPAMTDVVDVGGHVDVYADAGISAFAKVKGFGITVRPTYYLPLVHVPETKATARYYVTDGGLLKAEARADVSVYSAFDLQQVDDDYGGSARDFSLTKDGQLSNGGFALDFEVEHGFFDEQLDVGVFGQIPVTAGRLKYKASTDVYAYYSLDLVREAAGESTKQSDYGVGERVYSSADLRVHRPLRLGAEALWRPFGWFGVAPMGAVVVRNPYTPGSRKVFGEYGLDLNFYAGNIARFSIGTGYENQVFVHRAGIGLNARAAELLVQASLRGSSLKESVKGTGAGAYVGVRLGW